MDAFTFWYRWLLVASVAFAVVGLVIALWPHGPLLALWYTGAAEVFFAGEMPAAVRPYDAFLMGPMGATIAGYFVLQAFVVWKTFPSRKRWAWDAVAGALGVWFVVDSSLSLIHGAVFNVVLINLPTLLLVGAPLAATYRAFTKAPAGQNPAGA